MMISMMEENPHSTRSPLRNLRQFAMTSGKRAHSPDGSPGDRPAKRLSLAIGDISIGCRHFSTSSVNGSRYHDAEMTMDPDESGVQPLQTSSYPTLALVSQHQHTDIESQLPNTLDGRYFEKIQPVSDVASPKPIIFTVPPNKQEQQSLTRPSTPTDSSSNAMVLSSPVTSFSQIPSPPPKRRVYFGPRMGCETCRLGVKGHFIHSE